MSFQAYLDNIQAKTGQSIAALHAAVAASGAAKHGERRTWLMEQFKLGYGDANAVANFYGRKGIRVNTITGNRLISL